MRWHHRSRDKSPGRSLTFSPFVVFRFLRLNLPRGNTPTGVAFGEGASQLVVSTQDIGGAGLCMFAAGNGKAAAEAKAQGKLPLPEIKWDKQHIHGKNNIITLVGAPSSYGSGDGSVVVASCSEGKSLVSLVGHRFLRGKPLVELMFNIKKPLKTRLGLHRKSCNPAMCYLIRNPFDTSFLDEQSCPRRSAMTSNLHLPPCPLAVFHNLQITVLLSAYACSCRYGHKTVES